MSAYKLLDENETVEEHDLAAEEAVCLEKSRSCSAIVGFVIGLFIQGSSLALNFIMSYTAEDHVISMKTYAIATTFWSVLSGVMGVSVLLLLRGLVITTFYSTNSATEPKQLEEKEQFMVQVLHNLEKYFSIGAVGGVGFAWAVTDYLLQIRGHVVESLLVFLLASLWYCVSVKKDSV